MDILISPLVNMLLLLYGVLGHSFVLAIIVATILIRMITLPLTLPQQRNSRKMAELAPQLEELKKKYGNDRNKIAQAQMELYKENKVNMFGGCLPLILQLVIMIAFYQALTGSLATNPLQLQTLSHRVMPAFVPLIPINPIFLIYDLGLPGILPVVEQNVSPLVAQLLVFILPVLVVATTYLSQKLMATAQRRSQPGFHDAPDEHHHADDVRPVRAAIRLGPEHLLHRVQCGRRGAVVADESPLEEEAGPGPGHGGRRCQQSLQDRSPRQPTRP